MWLHPILTPVSLTQISRGYPSLFLAAHIQVWQASPLAWQDAADFEAWLVFIATHATAHSLVR